MLQRLEELQSLAAKNDYEATRLEKILLNEILPKGDLSKEDVYYLVENIYGIASISISLVEAFSQKYEALRVLLKSYAETTHMAIEAVNYSTPLKIKELEEDIPILDFKLKIKSRLSKERLYSKIETELNGMYERLKIIRSNYLLVVNYYANVEKINMEHLRHKPVDESMQYD